MTLDSTSASGSRRRRTRVALGLTLSAGLLFWILRDLDPQRVLQVVGEANVSRLAVGILLAGLTIPLRALRWRLILRPLSGGLRFLPIFHAFSLGLLANGVLPARTGDIVRAGAVARLTPVRFSTAIVSIGLERMFDLAAILALLALALASGGWTSAHDSATAFDAIFLVGGCAILLLVAGTLLTVAHPEWPGEVVRRVGRLLPGAIGARLQNAGAGIAAGLHALRDPSLMSGIFLASLIIWCTNAAAFWIGLHAFRIYVPWSGPVLVQTFVVFGMLLPSTPGNFGPFEYACRLALGLYSIDPARSVSFALAFHVLAYYVPGTMIGLWSLSRAGVTYDDLNQPTPEGPLGSA